MYNTDMNGNAIFNSAVCIIGISILLIHIVNVFLKKNRRVDENRLLYFLIFTVIHFSVYLAFTLAKPYNPYNEYIVGFYTVFYIFNNIEVFLLFYYMVSYVQIEDRIKKLITLINCSIFAIYVILDIINIFTVIFFYANGGIYERTRYMILSQGYQFVIFIIIFFVTLFNEKLVLREKIAFAIYCLLPLVAIIIQNYIKGYAIAYLSIIVAIEVLFFFVNVSKNIQLAQEQEKRKEAQIKVMMSQIQPHFIYNSLSAISTLITIDPNKAQKALDDFTEYLRHNLSSLTETNLVPFEEELKHIEAYVFLEKVRFNDRLTMIYDIEATDFYVPPLSIQPIVENAIKHGILKKIDGGKVKFSTYESADAYIVEVKDDGVGFNESEVNFDENKHVGLKNIKQRLKTMCNADIKIDSELGKGTTVVVTFYK